jgi:succinoglycan biosynthesis protein ExoM
MIHASLSVTSRAPGVANARNAGLRHARGQLIAFLDDDEIAPSSWLAELLRVQAAEKADVVFGPVRTKLSEPPRNHRAYFEAFFARDPGHAEGSIDRFYGCGCSLVRRAALPSAEPFSAERNEIGGEDDLLFQAMDAAGARFAWAPGAWVWETPEPSRVTLAYTLRRAFAYGQGPATQAWSARRRDYPAIGFWMAVGLAQTVVFGALAAGSYLGKTQTRATVYRRFVEGVGKVLWVPGHQAALLWRRPDSQGATPQDSRLTQRAISAADAVSLKNVSRAQSSFIR